MKALRLRIASAECELASRDERIRDLLAVEDSLKGQLMAVRALSLTLTVTDAPAPSLVTSHDEQRELRHQVQVCAI